MKNKRPAIRYASILLGFSLLGCTDQGKLDLTVGVARKAVLGVRPDADLEDVRGRIWTPATDVESLAQDDESWAMVRRFQPILDAQGPGLVRLGVGNQASMERLRKAFGSHELAWAEGIAIPSKGLFLVRPGQADSLALVAHELAHLASARKGYHDKTRGAISIHIDGAFEPARVDLDAMIAWWALSEADAVLTCEAALLAASKGPAAMEELWKKEVASDVLKGGHRGVGPATVVHPDGTKIRVESGEEFIHAVDLFESLTQFAYVASISLPLARHENGEALEDTLRSTWAGFSSTTKEILFPRSAATPSRLAGILRTRPIGEGVLGATRIGAFLVRHMLMYRGHLSGTTATEIVRDYEDDAALRVGENGLLWLIEWKDEAAAKRFAGAYRRLPKEGRCEVDGRWVVVEAGAVPDRDRLLTTLRER